MSRSLARSKGRRECTCRLAAAARLKEASTLSSIPSLPFPPTVIFLVIFNLLWLLVIYTYLNIILTGPGFAKDVSW